MIRILFIHGITAIGGAEKDLLMILEGLDKSRFYPVVVLPDRGPLARKIQNLGIKCHFSSLPPWRKFKYFPFILPSLIRLYYLVVKEKTDLIHVNDMWWIPLGCMVSQMARIPTVAFLRAELEIRRIRQYWLTRPTLLIPVSNSIKKTLLENNVDPQRIQTIYHGVNSDGSPQATGNTKSGSHPNPPVIGTIANIFPWKGLEYLIQAIDHLKPNFPGIRCLIVGKGDKNYQNKLELLVKELSLEDHIEFMGFQEDVNSCLSEFEIFVLPSITEGFGIVILEAMAMRKAVVATRVGGIPEIVQDGRTGLLVPPGNSIAIADAIQTLLENEPLRHQFEKAGYDRICQNFSRQKMIEEISAVYARLAHQSSDRLNLPNTHSRPKISALIITLNEEKNINDCLDRLGWVDEIIVVDAESQDKTEEICSKYPVRWFKRPWPGFGPQKNFGIEQAKGDWVLIVDADERVTPELKNEILSEIRGEHPNAGYEIPRKNFFYGRWIRYGGAYPDYQLRLFKKNVGHYDQTPVHEQFILNGTVGYLKSPLDHFTERQIYDHFKKFDQYTSLAAKHELDRKRSPHWSQCLINPGLTFLKIYILKKGFLNGVHGLIYSCFVAMYTFVKYAKLWELKEK